MLYDRMAEALPKPVNLKEEVASIDPSAKSVTFTSGRTVNYDFLINTMPLKELVKKIIGCPEDVIAATQDLHHTEGMFVGIGVAGPCPSTKCWMYFPESDSPFYRVTYLSNYSPKMTPPGDHFSLLAEVSVSSFKQENADDVVDRTIAGMVSSKLLTPEQAASKIVSRQLLRVPYSYPVPTTGRDRALAAIHPWLTKQGIYSRGRFGAWRYEIGNTDHCVMQGVEIAEFLALGTPERTWALLPGEESRARIS
jgi:protoporphyrinogen oxidase